MEEERISFPLSEKRWNDLSLESCEGRLSSLYEDLQSRVIIWGDVLLPGFDSSVWLGVEETHEGVFGKALR